MKQRRDAGFGFFEIIILILLLLAILFMLWYFFFGGKSDSGSAPANTPAQQEKPKEEAKKDPTEGWKEYCSPLEKSCFKYPADWTFGKESDSYPNEEFMSAKSPAGTKVRWGANITGVGGSCDPETEPAVYIQSVKAVPAVANLYATSTTVGQAGAVNAYGLVNGNNNQAPQVGSTNDCMYIHLFKSKDGTRQMWLNASSIQPAELATVELILLSYHY